MIEDNCSPDFSSPPPPLFEYTVTPQQVDIGTTQTFTIGIYNPKSNGFVACSLIEFGISIGTAENDLTDDATDVEGQSIQSNWGIQKQPYVQSPLVFKVEPATGTSGLSPGESISFTMTGVNIETEGAGEVMIVEVTSGQTGQKQLLINKVSPDLQITGFTAEPNPIGPGTSSTLSWSTLGATSCAIDQLESTLCSPPGSPPYLSPPDFLAPNGKVTVCPLETTTYTLTAYDAGGGYLTQQFTINVGGAQIIRFWAEPFEPIDCTDPEVRLRWEVHNANQLILIWDPGNLNGTDVTGKSSYIVTPAVDTTYTLHALGSPPATPWPITIYVNPASITSFTAEPSSFIRGQSVTLSWETEHACSCAIDQSVGAVEPASGGSVVVHPQAETTYTLTANGLGQSATHTATATPQASGWNLATSTGPTATIGFNYQGRIWMIDTFNGLVRSSTDGVNWIPVANSLPFGQATASNGAVFDDGNGEKMWIVGEGIGKFSNSLWHSADGVTWTEVQPSNIWDARRGLACLAFQNKLWVMGGETANGVDSNDVWSSPDGVRWTEVTASAPWATRAGFGAAVYHPSTPTGVNQMWICGGVNSQDAWYTNDGETWTQAPASPPSGLLPNILMLNDKLYLFNSLYGQPEMWMMDASMNWTKLPDQLPSGCVDLSCVVYHWQIWAAGPPIGAQKGYVHSYTP